MLAITTFVRGVRRMADERKHSYWKVWGFAATCAECGHVDIGEYKYCSNCGSIMDEPSVWECPPLMTIPTIKVFTCPKCKTDSYEISKPNFCRICGAEMGERKDEVEE